MLNILAAGELHYWNVLRQHIQDNDRGDRVSHKVWLYNCHGSSKHAALTLARHKRGLMSSVSDEPPRSPSDLLSISDCLHSEFKCLQLEK